MIDHALWYRNQGMSVIPQMPGAKRPLVRWKQFQSSLPSVELITRWWTRWPDAGICLILGPVSGIVAVDVDSLQAQDVFFQLLGGAPQTATALSGSRRPGKAHYFYVAPDFPTAARHTPLGRQLEFRGAGGYVVLPPSLHPSGHRYEWSVPHWPPATMPEALAAEWQRNRRFAAATVHSPPVAHDEGQLPQSWPASSDGLASVLRVHGLASSTQRWLRRAYAHSPQWNSRLFRAACDLAGLSIPIEVAEPLLLRGAQPDTPADERQARQTIRSAYSVPRVPLREYSRGAGSRRRYPR